MNMRVSDPQGHPILKVTIPGATPDELGRGLAAAMAVFIEAKVDPADAAAGAFEREGWDISGFEDEIDDAALNDAEVWDRAHTAALNAITSGWHERRRERASVRLQLITDPEVQLADRKTALEMLRVRARAEDGNAEFLDSKVGTLAWVLAEHLEDRFRARELVANVTMAFTALQCAGHSPEEPIEPKRNAVLKAIDALENATQKARRHA